MSDDEESVLVEHEGQNFTLAPEAAAEFLARGPQKPDPGPAAVANATDENTPNYVMETPPQDETTYRVAPEEMGMRWQGGTQARDVKTTASETVSGARPVGDDMRERSAESTAERLGIAEMGAEHAIRKAKQLETNLAGQMVDEQEQLRERQTDLAQAESRSEAYLGDLNDSITRQKGGWVQGDTPKSLFDGGAGTGMVLSSIGVALAGLGGAGMQQNAMQMVNQSMDRSARQQEFQVNSLFKRLDRQYDNRDQARSALKMMQLEYASTMADHYAAQNLTPEIALNLADLKNGIRDEYMKQEDLFRAQEYGKRSQTQNERHVQGTSGRMVPLQSARDLQAQAQLEKTRAETDKVKADTGKVLSETEKQLRQAQLAQDGVLPPPDYEQSKVQLAKIDRKEAALNRLKAVHAKHNGARFDPNTGEQIGSVLDNNTALGYVVGGDHKGLGLLNEGGSQGMRFADESKATTEYRSAVENLATADTDGSKSAGALQGRKDIIMGGKFEDAQVEGIETALSQGRQEIIDMKKSIPGPHLDYSEKIGGARASAQTDATNYANTGSFRPGTE